MLRNYFKIAWRNLRKQPGFTFINVFGLAAGLICFTLIALWVNDELSYDRFNKHYDRIVRLTVTEQTETEVTASARTSALAAPVLQMNYPEVENAVRIERRGELVEHNSQQTMEPDILLTEPSFFDVFSYRLLRGNPITALRNPYSVVLTESTAKKYFNAADPLGQTLTIHMYDSTGRGAKYTVTGIVADPPRNAHFTFSMLGSFRTVEVAAPDYLNASGWKELKFYTYLLLKEEVSPQTLSSKLTRFHERYAGTRTRSEGAEYEHHLQHLCDIHLRSHLPREMASNGDINQIYIFSTIGLFILLLAGINYTNLATARSVSRAKEVGVKKVVGALKTELILQYLIESTCLALLALLVSGLVTLALQPFLYTLIGKNLSLLTSPGLLLFLAGITLVLGVLAGMYPAFVLSSFKPISVLKGTFKSSSKGVFLRQSLVVVQFVITLLLVISIVVIDSQLSYIKHKNLGYDPNALLFLRLNGNAEVVKGYEAFKDEVLANPIIAGVTTSNSAIVNGLETGSVETVDAGGKSVGITLSTLQADENYLNVHGIRIRAGRNLMPRTPGDSIQQVILNEQAVRNIGWKNAEAAIGKPFQLDGQPGTVVGVVENFHFNSLQHAIQPLAIASLDNYFSRITIKVNRGEVSQTVALIRSVWKKHFSGALFDYEFLDRLLTEQYRAEERFSTIVTYFSFLSLLIACLGLYGLITHTTAQRTKEIGIRKTLGATVNGIVVMLATDFLQLVVFASFIAIPLAWYLMSQWLQSFVYRIGLEWWMFAASVLLVLLIALLTVSFQSIKAALTNPVKSLRSE
jgi:putative ABC transport system permease protein